MDNHTNKSRIIPNDFFEFCSLLKAKTNKEEVYKYFQLKNRHIIDEYFHFLIENDFGFFCNEDEFDRFPEIETKYVSPNVISNSVIELNQNGIYNRLNSILSQLENLGCNYLSIIFYDKIQSTDIDKVIELVDCYHMKSLELTIPYEESLENYILNSIGSKMNSLTRINLTSSPTDNFREADNIVLFDIFYTEEIINSFKNCGKVNKKHFYTNLEKTLEAKCFNSCLNKKISINIEGNICNCPGFKTNDSYGNINEKRLIDVIENTNFKDIWKIKKDEIEVCKDCEFRYVCTDCRAFIEDESNLFSKPLKCKYNPYEALWND